MKKMHRISILGFDSTKSISLISVGIVYLICFLYFTGAVFNIQVLKSISPKWMPMHFMTAICTLCAAIAISLFHIKGRIKNGLLISRVLGILILIAAVGTIAEYIFVFSTGNSLFTFNSISNGYFLTPEFSMAFITSLIFFFIGLIIILLSIDKKITLNIAHSLTILVALQSYLIISSYFLGVYTIHQFLNMPVAINTGIAFLFICLAIFTCKTESWFMQIYVSESTGGIMARRLLPGIIVLPLVIGWMRINGERIGLFNSEVGVVLVAVTYVFCLLLLIWANAKSVGRIDDQRRIAEELLAKKSQRLEILSDNANRLLSSDNPKELINELCIKVMKFLDCQVYFNYSFKEDISKLQLTSFEGISDSTAMEIEWLDLGEAICGNVAIEKQGKIIDDINNNENDRLGIVKKLGLTAYACQPLLCRDKVIGTLSFGTRTRSTFNEEEIAMMKVMADQIVLGLNRFNNEESLKNSEEKYAAIYDNAPFGVTLTKMPEVTIVSVNDAFLNLFQYTRDEVIGKTSVELGIVDNQSRQPIADELNKNGYVRNFECTRHTKNGIQYDLLLNLNWVTIGGQKFILTTTQNITERKEYEQKLVRSEEQYRNLVEISPYAVFINRGGRIIYVNPSALTLFGAQSGVEIIGKSPFVIFHPNDHPLVQQRIGKVLSGEFVPIIEIKIIRLDGSERVVEITGSKFIDPEGPAIQVILRDITERKKAQAIQLRYQLISEYARDPFLLMGANGEIKEANHAAEEFYGYSYEELLNLRIHDLRVENEMAINSQLSNALDKGILFEATHLHKNGAHIPVEVSSRGVKIDNQDMLLSVVRDISERVKSEQALREQAKMLELAPVLVRNMNNEIIIWNNGLEKIYGFKDSETVGKICHEVLQTQFPESLELIMEHLQRKGKWEGELHHIGKNGEEVLVLSTWLLYKDIENNSIAIIEVNKDITKRKKAEKELRESEERLNLALENGNIGVWVWDIQTNEISWDNRMERMFGIEPGTFLKTYAAFESFVVEEDIPHVQLAIERALHDDIHFETVYRIKMTGDNFHYINAKALVTRDENGTPLKMTGVCFDVTDMKKGAEQVLLTLNEELLRSNKELEQFAYVASHDLQEPLRMVSSFTQLLGQRYSDKLDQDAKEFIQFAVDGASRMQTLINDLLAFSRIQTKGKIFKITDMHEIFGKARYNLSVRINEKNALITNDELPEVFVDEGQMVQLFQNLIGNSLKFSQNTPHIHISSKEFADHYLFSVMDNGIGIEKQYFDRIFQIFQRLLPKDQYEGTGIGLAICKRIVERHNGTIWVESEIGTGTTFYFTIPKKH